MHKVLGINCSCRRYGNSDVLLQEALLSARESGTEVEYLRLSDYNIKQCRGCLSCVFTGRCVIKDDDMPFLWDKMKTSDGLLVSAPTYVFSPAGIVKMVIDRAFICAKDLDDVFGRNRVAAIISVAGNSEWNPLGVENLNVLPLAYGYRIVDYLEAYATGPGEVLLDEKNINGAKRLGVTVAAELQGKSNRKNPEPGQCPVCYSKSFHFSGSGEVMCCTCGINGRVSLSEGKWTLTTTPDDIQNHFFSYKHRREHLDNWIIPSKDKFLANREAIKERLRKYKEVVW
ncbi:MAG: Iron-sulfur flavoprotein [Pelotomaculum sp. PtaB.Bin013]|uniref:Flavodoxin family protein n=1 Tax=Pelotomaculum isophthalicicum JI TaxID=947010 RepID=A0A9X4GY15_9FIRM|nr:flavodoxin family protein [Pelotomaculum isophthalicicum]MDF9407327.1 flavodoxin family protein [Pelotomaculum isophthalicicum JI]OPX90620.1 MAG: Iron-sulfur flavoprotein [Pelotomaculum sp. PtaB.Bin013]